MANEREIEVLEYNIADLDKKIFEFEAHDISEIKIDKLREKKAKYELQLSQLKS